MNLTEETKILFQRKLHEESLLPNRLTVFILASTVLLLSFTQALSVIQVAKAISFAGIFTCAIAFIHGLRTKDEMGRIDKNLYDRYTNQGKEKEKVEQCWEIMGIKQTDFTSCGIFRGRSIFLWLSVVFGGLWGFSIWYAFSAPFDWRFWVSAFGPPVIFVAAWFIWGSWKSAHGNKQADDKPTA